MPYKSPTDIEDDAPELPGTPPIPMPIARPPGEATGDLDDYDVPRDAQFNAEFMEAPGLYNVGTALIQQRRKLAHIQGARILYVYSQKDKKKNGKAVLGTCEKPSGKLLWSLEHSFGMLDFLVTLYAPAVREFSPARLERVVFHELMHIEGNANDGWKTRGHDFEGFLTEIEEYPNEIGEDMRAAGEAFKQMGLPDAA
jgi:hypothetical protein